MSVRTVTSTPTQQAPVQEGGKYSTRLPGIFRRVGLFALGALAIYAAANIPGADAGPLAYAACTAACGPFAWGGIIACLPLLFAPTP